MTENYFEIETIRMASSDEIQKIMKTAQRGIIPRARSNYVGNIKIVKMSKQDAQKVAENGWQETSHSSKLDTDNNM